MSTTATLVKKSICKCGHSLLNEDVPLGQKYELVSDQRMMGTFGCGGCGQLLRVNCIKVAGGLTGSTGWLPEVAFELSE